MPRNLISYFVKPAGAPAGPSIATPTVISPTGRKIVVNQALPVACVLPTNTVGADPHFANNAARLAWIKANPTCPVPPPFKTTPVFIGAIGPTVTSPVVTNVTPPVVSQPAFSAAPDGSSATLLGLTLTTPEWIAAAAVGVGVIGGAAWLLMPKAPARGSSRRSSARRSSRRSSR